MPSETLNLRLAERVLLAAQELLAARQMALPDWPDDPVLSATFVVDHAAKRMNAAALADIMAGRMSPGGVRHPLMRVPGADPDGGLIPMYPAARRRHDEWMARSEGARLDERDAMLIAALRFT